jgi:hypothetical protein
MPSLMCEFHFKDVLSHVFVYEFNNSSKAFSNQYVLYIDTFLNMFNDPRFTEHQLVSKELKSPYPY